MKLYIKADENDDIEEWGRSDEGQEAQSQYSDIMMKSIQRSLKDCEIGEDVGDTGQDTWIISSPDGDEYTYDFNLNDQLERIRELGAKQAAKEDYREVVDYIRPLLSGNKDMDYFLDWLEYDSENSLENFNVYLVNDELPRYGYKRPAVIAYCIFPDYVGSNHVLEDDVDEIAESGIDCKINFYDIYEITYNFKYEDIYLLGPKKAASKCAKMIADMIKKDKNIQDIQETKYTDMLDDITDKGGYENAIRSILNIDVNRELQRDPYSRNMYGICHDFSDIIQYLKDPSPNTVTVKLKELDNIEFSVKHGSNSIDTSEGYEKVKQRIDYLTELLDYYKFNVVDEDVDSCMHSSDSIFDYYTCSATFTVSY